MNVDERVIQSRRGPLVIQSLAIVALAMALDSALQSWRVLRSSPLGRAGDSLGLPVIAVVIVALGIWLAITLVRDSWGHRVVLDAKSLTINDSLGSYTVRTATSKGRRRFLWVVSSSRFVIVSSGSRRSVTRPT
ncbi:MAG TPA: hypothetical protein VHJ58_19405 [Vicinamibacterales bacterium]|nr:hypothetical protein [Vicinamibacterales bacterium]